MITEDQSRIIELLGLSATHHGAEVERIDTHTAVIFLAGSRAWKLKRAVRFDYLDSSTAVDWVVEMDRFAQRRPEYGGSAGIRRVIDGNATGFDEFGEGVFDPDLARQLIGQSRRELERHQLLLDARARAGFVRQCHGDLHLRNIVLLDGEPVRFDAIEFNDDIACIDVLYDFAFLLMDLWHRALPRHANAAWNAYLRATGDLTGLAALPLLLSCRAAVRAKTSATSASFQRDAARASGLRTLAREYMTLARRLLRPPAARLIAIGGYSGSGKSTLALAMAPSMGAVPGALVLRSDEIRKELCGRPLTDRLTPDGYAPEVSEQVYATLSARADVIVRGGHSVIVDAVYRREHHRDAIERVAADADVPFAGFWLDAPAATLVDRVQSRRSDASDADAGVISVQRAQDGGTMRWARIDASPAPTRCAGRSNIDFGHSPWRKQRRRAHR